MVQTIFRNGNLAQAVATFGQAGYLLATFTARTPRLRGRFRLNERLVRNKYFDIRMPLSGLRNAGLRNYDRATRHRFANLLSHRNLCSKHQTDDEDQHQGPGCTHLSTLNAYLRTCACRADGVEGTSRAVASM